MTPTSFVRARPGGAAPSPRIARERTGWRPAGVVALALFALALLSGVALVTWGVGGVPVRLVPLLACAAVLLLARPDRVGEALRLTARPTMLLTAIAALALIVSLANGEPGALIVRQLMELHGQAAFALITACALALTVGARAVLLTFLAVFGLSFAVATLQFVGLDPAWGARAALGSLMRDPPITQAAYLGRERAMGLAYSPIHFAIQSCLALVAVLICRARGRDVLARVDLVLVVAVGVLGLGCVMTGNRSPLLGLVVFAGLYGGLCAPRLIVVIAPLVLGALLAVGPLLDLLSDTGVRVASTADGSAAGRSTLRAYGLHLLSLRPFGWGLGFDSVDHWATFGAGVRYMENPLVIRDWALHNYYLMILCKHGLLLLFALPFLVPRSRWAWLLWLGFAPYLIHNFFHNDGPLQGDFLVFTVLGVAIAAAPRVAEVEEPPPAQAARRSWRRAFA